MHIIMAFLGFLITVFTVLYYAQRIGLDFRNLNPFAWKRRRDFRKKHDGEALFKLAEPIDAAGALVTLVIKADGDISTEQKDTVVGLFESELGLNPEAAKGLLGASAFMIGNGELVKHKVGDILRPSMQKFSSTQAASVLEMMIRASEAEGEATTAQLSIIEQARNVFAKRG